MRVPPSLVQADPEGSLGARLRRWNPNVPRRTFLKAAAGSAAVACGSGLLHPWRALADPPGSGTPVPIPGGAPELGGVFHVFLPFPGMEPSTITDFNGFTGVAVIDGHWTGPGSTAESMYEADMRFMKGLFVGADGRSRQGTFGFI
jgi:hypothetical protein